MSKHFSNFLIYRKSKHKNKSLESIKKFNKSQIDIIKKLNIKIDELNYKKYFYVSNKNKIKNKFEDITIIINSYEPNIDKLLKSINSCLNQKNVNVNIIVSTVENDITVNFINGLNNNKIHLVISKIFEHPGKGPKGIYFQLNKALKMVKTRFVTYFSSNDIMYSTKLYNEIEEIKKTKSFICFSDYYLIYKNHKKAYNYNVNKMNYSNLLKMNYINDCATIDLEKLNRSINFNYEKYENVCYWHLWLSLFEKFGKKCFSYNNRIEWEYFRNENESQSIKRNKNKYETEKYQNLREFMLSEFNKKIIPKSLYNYSYERIWWWNDINNKKPIEMTVALPALNANKIIWLALESLKNQININFSWELIIFEEDGISKDIIKKYAGKLPGCVRIIYRIITTDDIFYNINDINKNKCTSYYTLLEKWINIAKYSDKNSKIFVKHACDCYSPPKRLYIHYEHFKNNMCYYSTQLKGYFYHIKYDKWMLYDGSIFEPVYWDKYGPNKVKYLDSNYIDNPNVLTRGCHLNMALRTDIMKKIKLPLEPKRAGLDGYILNYITKLTNIRPEEEKIIFTFDEIDKNTWKYSLDTDGYNNISKRDQYYYKINKKYPWKIPKEEVDVKIILPEYIISKLKDLN